MNNEIPSITIRLAVPADAPDMAQIHMRSWEAAYSYFIPSEYIKEKNAKRPELWKRIINDENNTNYVILIKNKIVGIMSVVPTPQDADADCNTCELEGIYLHPDYYRMGIGTKALDYAFEIARKWNKTAITLWVLADNTNSIKFYYKCGFTPDGKEKVLKLWKTAHGD